MISRFRRANRIPGIYFFVLLLTARVPLRAQSPVFADAPDTIIRSITAANPNMPVQTSHDIAVIETNVLSYLALLKPIERYYRLNRLIELEGERTKPAPDLRRYWYEFIEAKAPALTVPEIDSIAQDWWRANGYQAVKHDERYAVLSASFKEVRAHLRIFRTGSAVQVNAAEQWLIMAQMAGGWDSFRLPPQTEGLSPLAHLLARDILEETKTYTGPEADKLRNTLKSLLVGKFTVKGEDGITRPLSTIDVGALVDALASEDKPRKAEATDKLENWLMQTIDADLNRAAQDSRVNRPAASH